MRSTLFGTERTLRTLILALLVSACASTAPPPGEAGRPPGPWRETANSVRPFPGASWEHANAAAAGYCEDRLAAVKASAAKLPTTAMMAIVGGRVVFEYGDVSRVSYLASVRKSVLAILYGNYVDSGKIRLDKTLEQLKIDDIGGLLPIEKQATVADLLGARSGVYHPASNPGDSLADAPPRGSQKPGTYFLYSNWDFNALGTIF